MAAKPASVFVEAEGNDDSDEEGHTIAVDVWLSVNRITNVEDVQQIFTERQITIEELLEFNETDLRSFCKELQFDTLSTTRIINGVKNTLKDSGMAAPAAPAAPSANPTDDVIADNINNDMIELNINNMNAEEAEPVHIDNKVQLQHVIVSPQEHEAMEKMYKRYDMTSTLNESILKCYKLVAESSQNAKADLNEKFELLFEQMKLRQEELTAVIDELEQYKIKALQQQNDELISYKLQISDGKKEYERLISDVSLDIHRRKMQIMAMINNVMDNKVPLSLVTQPEIKVLMPLKAISTFLEAVAVDNCDRPTAPVLILEKVSFDAMTVSWQTEFDQLSNCVSNRKAAEYQLCFAKFTKEFIMSKKDRKRAKKKAVKMKKKNKKKDKKRKRKKKKRRKYDSSSPESESSTDTESDSDSSSSSSSTDSDSDSYSSSSGVDIDELTKKNVDDKKVVDEGDNDNELNPFNNIDLSVLNWKRLRLNSKTKSFRIKTLVHGWSYLVRIRGKNASGWGQYSQAVKASTKTINLIWNQHKHGKGITFLSKSRCKFSSKQAKVCADYKIRSKTHKIFCWEFKLHRISSYSYIGFVRGPSKQYVSNWNYYLGGNNMNEFSIGVSNGSKSISIQNNGGYNHQQSVTLTKSIRTGDRFKFKANMKNKTVTIYHNGKNIGNLFQNIPSCIVPAASNNSSHLEISINFAN